MALVAQEEEKKKGAPLVVQLAALVAVTALAVGMGWFTGGYLERRQPAAPAAEPAPVKEEAGAADGEHGAKAPAGMPQSLVPLEPITTNLADPTEVWLRMELAILFDGEPDPVLAQAVHQDLFAFMRTVKLRQIESASGFQYLKADLRERARIRSDGRVVDVLVKTLLYE
ncbi:flagellar basal body-associated FliL family protein [Chelativorans intermedius]|uniref:Flagellar protein FliL n=1 Tax=Chelativorans intermedius TaxID=515947 RepID=A0ABV6D8S9_9HYPH|nr:flagellar basal body-associated FliL family protein [Chelativorans intermedius]MCT8997781.1 flagellar basal body-associated FliL family protein [Chelativorans intermedius]